MISNEQPSISRLELPAPAQRPRNAIFVSGQELRQRRSLFFPFLLESTTHDSQASRPICLQRHSRNMLRPKNNGSASRSVLSEHYTLFHMSFLLTVHRLLHSPDVDFLVVLGGRHLVRDISPDTRDPDALGHRCLASVMRRRSRAMIHPRGTFTLHYLPLHSPDVRFPCRSRQSRRPRRSFCNQRKAQED